MQLTKEQRDFIANMITLGLSLILAILIGTIAINLIIESLPDATQHRIANLNVSTVTRLIFDNIMADIKLIFDITARTLR